MRSRVIKGKLAYPLNRDAVQQFMGAVDIGETSVDIFQDKEMYLGKTITLGSEEMNMQQVANIFSEVLDREIKY